MARSKDFLRVLESRYHLWRGVRRFRGEIAHGRVSDLAVAEMWLGWGNTEWSASPPLAVSVGRIALREARSCALEFGTGLTTLVLGLVGDQMGFSVVSVDHDEKWCEYVRGKLTEYRIQSVKVVHAPLVDYGAYSWYSKDAIPSLPEIDLVVVDGPPASTKGGRSGILAQVGDRLGSRSTIILDDVSRADEWALAGAMRDALGRNQDTYRLSPERAFSVLNPVPPRAEGEAWTAR